MRALLAFFTVLPVRGATLTEAAARVYLLPLVGLIAGLPGAVALLLGYVLSPAVAATLALSAVLIAAGLHHSDGVLDTGDALMARGTQRRRREVLKDTRVGVGGICALFFVYAPAVTSLASLASASPVRAALALVAGEVAARSAMLLALAFGSPAETTSSSVAFVDSVAGRRKTVAVALALVLPFVLILPLGGAAPLAALCVPLVTAGALRVANGAFGGISGDVVGATGEVARMAVLVALSATV